VNVIVGILLLWIEFVVLDDLTCHFLDDDETSPPTNPPDIVLITPLIGLIGILPPL